MSFNIDSGRTQIAVLDITVANSAENISTNAAYLTYLQVTNPSATAGYLQLFDDVAANVTVGATTPKLSFLIPANGAFDVAFIHPPFFKQGLSYAAATTATGAGAIGTNLILNALYA